jgi:hypothetical protein
MTDRTIAAAVSGTASDRIIIHLADVAVRLWQGWHVDNAEEFELCEWAWERAIIEGIYSLAERIGVDGSNLRKAIASRKLSTGMLNRLRSTRQNG